MSWLPPDLATDGVIWAISSPLVYGFICTKVNRAPLLPILATAFVAGFLTSYVAYITEASLALGGFGVGSRHAWTEFLAFVALPEELVKLAALIGLTHNVESRSRVSFIIACFIGCGFAASENLVYLSRFGGDVISTRFLTATAFHVFNAILMARLLVTKSISDDSFRMILALAIPVLLHGTYDYFVMQEAQDGGKFLFVLGFAVAAGFVTLRAHPMTVQAP
jgi:RsiW-degrading membrane proteinase PrsW (M82 family)